MAGKTRLSGFGAKARLTVLSAVLAGASFFAAAAHATTRHYVHHTVPHLAYSHSHLHGHVSLARYHHTAPLHLKTVAYHPHYVEHHDYAAHHVRLAEYHPHYVEHHSEYHPRLDHHVRLADYHPHYIRPHYIHNRAALYRHSSLQCVPYAREVSHIDLTGNAFLWWAEAAGRYARGAVPVEGAVLNFRSIGRMPLGHVAVVTDVINSRTILVTPANWVAGAITNDVTVQDVSPENNWSEVEVELGDSRTWGSAYPTYGFIYDKPSISTVIAANGQSNEVAEAPSVHAVSTEGPDRNLQ